MYIITVNLHFTYAGTNLSISVDNDRNLWVTVGNNTENLSHLCNLGFKGKIIDDKFLCNFGGHSGTIKLEFEKNKIILTIKYNSNSSKDSLWVIGAGTDVIGNFNLVDSKNNVLFKLPEFYGNEKGTFTSIKAISFTDANNDGLNDILL